MLEPEVSFLYARIGVLGNQHRCHAARFFGQVPTGHVQARAAVARVMAQHSALSIALMLVRR